VPKNESTESTIMLRAFLSITRPTTQKPKPWPPFNLQRARHREQNVTLVHRDRVTFGHSAVARGRSNSLCKKISRSPAHRSRVHCSGNVRWCTSIALAVDCHSSRSWLIESTCNT
jgi:hypothetical protein